MVLARPPTPTTENTIRLDGPSINQFIHLRLYETQCPQPQIPQWKGTPLKPYLSPLLQSLSKSNHQHTHLYISGNLLNLPMELQDYQIDPKRLWANGPRCSEITLGRRIFSLSLWWECKKLRVVTTKNDAIIFVQQSLGRVVTSEKSICVIQGHNFTNLHLVYGELWYKIMSVKEYLWVI